MEPAAPERRQLAGPSIHEAGGKGAGNQGGKYKHDASWRVVESEAEKGTLSKLPADSPLSWCRSHANRVAPKSLQAEQSPRQLV